MNRNRSSVYRAALLGMVSWSILPALAAGPEDRRATDPRSVVSSVQRKARPIRVEDINTAIHVTDASLSTDGQTVAYISDASGRPNVWIMTASGGSPHQLVHSDERQSGPVFSRDGREILFAQDASGDENYDLYAISTGGGEPRNLTHTTDSTEYAPLFSPDGSKLAFITKAAGSPTPNLAVIAWPNGAIRPITRDPDPKANWTPACWSPDSKYLYAVRVGSLDDSDIYRIDIATGAMEILAPHTGHARVRVTDVSPDGNTLLLTSNAQGGYFNVALFDSASGQLRWVTDTRWEASSGGFSPDGKTFYYSLNADGRTSLHFVATNSLKELDRPLPPGLNEAGAAPQAFLPDGGFLLSHQDSSHPANLYVVGPKGDLKPLTRNESAGLAAVPLPSSQVIVYPSFDGQLISAFLWMPFNLKRDGSAAAVILPHGGPTGQTVDDFNRRAVTLVSRGFVVLAPNVRGSTGYGMAFQRANIQDLGGADLRDEVAGLEFLKGTGFVDSRKVGIWGASYGGFMTLMAIGKFPTLWAAAVDEFGILDWSAMLTRSEPELQEYEKSLLGDPEKDRSVYENSSPLKYIRNATAPLLVLQGEKDIRVPKEETEQVIAILQSQHKPVSAVFYPPGGHPNSPTCGRGKLLHLNDS
jgi:dipeptidyl aminopeptidase/acylaminoacyl peptidase